MMRPGDEQSRSPGRIGPSLIYEQACESRSLLIAPWRCA